MENLTRKVEVCLSEGVLETNNTLYAHDDQVFNG